MKIGWPALCFMKLQSVYLLKIGDDGRNAGGQLRNRITDKNRRCHEARHDFGGNLTVYIVEEDIAYSNDEISILIKDIKNGDNLIEVETNFNLKFNSIDGIIKYLKEKNMPLDFSNYFVKKAEIELCKVLNKREK